MLEYLERYCNEMWGEGVWLRVRAEVVEALEDTDMGFGIVTSRYTGEQFVDDACFELGIDIPF